MEPPKNTQITCRICRSEHFFRNCSERRRVEVHREQLALPSTDSRQNAGNVKRGPARPEPVPRPIAENTCHIWRAGVICTDGHRFIRLELIDEELQLASRMVRLGDGQEREMYGPLAIQLEVANQMTVVEVYGQRQLVEDVVLGVYWLLREEAAISSATKAPPPGPAGR